MSWAKALAKRLWSSRLGSRSVSHKGQALIEYVLLLVVLSVFGQWLVKYFVDVLTEGTSILSVNMTYFLHTGVGW